MNESTLRNRIHAVWVDGLDLWEDNPSLHEDTQDAALRLAQIFESRIGRAAHVTEPANYTNHFIVSVAADEWSPSNRALSNSADPARRHGYSLWLEALISYLVPAVEITWQLGVWEAGEYRRTVVDLTEFEMLNTVITRDLEDVTTHILDDLSALPLERLELSLTCLNADPHWPCPYPWPSAPPSPDGWSLRHYVFDALSE